MLERLQNTVHIIYTQIWFTWESYNANIMQAIILGLKCASVQSGTFLDHGNNFCCTSACASIVTVAPLLSVRLSVHHTEVLSLTKCMYCQHFLTIGRGIILVF